MKYQLDERENVSILDGENALRLSIHNYLKVSNLNSLDGKEHMAFLKLPEWLADGIRELVKNKIEQDKET